MTQAEAIALVSAFEAFIDANIASAIRQHMPEYAPMQWDINETHNARNRLIRELINAVSISAEL